MGTQIPKKVPMGTRGPLRGPIGEQWRWLWVGMGWKTIFFQVCTIVRDHLFASILPLTQRYDLTSLVNLDKHICSGSLKQWFLKFVLLLETICLHRFFH